MDSLGLVYADSGVAPVADADALVVVSAGFAGVSEAAAAGTRIGAVLVGEAFDTGVGKGIGDIDVAVAACAVVVLEARHTGARWDVAYTVRAM
jgi:hypothetical protein